MCLTDDATGNSSVVLFEIGAHTDMLVLFESRPMQHWFDLYRIEQRFLSRARPRISFRPAEWRVTFKQTCLPGGWHKGLRPAPWIAEHWRK